MLYCIALIKLKTLQLKIWKYCRGHSSVLIAEWSGTEAAGQGENAEALMQLWCRLKKRNSWAVWLPSLYYCNVCTTATLMLKKTSLILRIITKPAWKACGCESCWTSLSFLSLTGSLLGSYGSFWINFSDLTGPYLALLGLTGPYLALLSLT